jgi:hypothetical protein
MSPAARSIFGSAIYLWVVGAVLVLAPNALLSMFDMPESDEVWVRVVGVLALILGYYYLGASREELTTFMKRTVYARLSVLAFFTAFVVLKLASPMLLVFGVVDARAATWTALALRAGKE